MYYKVGQRVKITSIESTRWQSFGLADRDNLLNKIYELVDDLGTSGEEHAWRIDTPFGVYNFVEFQFRALKKKGAIKAAKIPIMTLKEEVMWLNKIQSNFKNAGKVQNPRDDRVAYSPGLFQTQPDTPILGGVDLAIDESQDNDIVTVTF